MVVDQLLVVGKAPAPGVDGGGDGRVQDYRGFDRGLKTASIRDGLLLHWALGTLLGSIPNPFSKGGRRLLCFCSSPIGGGGDRR